MRTLQRYCESGRLDCLKTETPTGDAYVVDPKSVERAIGELKLIHGDRHDATSRDLSPPVARVVEPPEETDMSRPSATSRDSAQENNPVDDVRPTPTEPGVTRPVATDYDIYDHPYVKRLEHQLEKLETRYEAQIRRTEELQLKAHDKLVELQRMTTIGQSKTLADFMLQAKNWIVGGAPDDPPAPIGVGESKVG